MNLINNIANPLEILWTVLAAISVVFRLRHVSKTWMARRKYQRGNVGEDERFLADEHLRQAAFRLAVKTDFFLIGVVALLSPPGTALIRTVLPVGLILALALLLLDDFLSEIAYDRMVNRPKPPKQERDGRERREG